MTTSPTTPPEKCAPATRACDWFRWLGWLLAACLALACGYLYQTGRQARTEAEIKRIEAELAKTQAGELRQQLEAERIIAAHERAGAKKTDQAGAETK